jgi:CRP-like cAMP-binding protein
MLSDKAKRQLRTETGEPDSEIEATELQLETRDDFAIEDFYGQLEAGDAFGWLGVASPPKPKAMSAYCLSNCFYLVLNRSRFLEVVS